jgi:hypothetical protein
MDELTEAQETKIGALARRRARQLGVKVGDVARGAVTGAYHSPPLDLVEFCLHEAAHLITLGHDPSDFPKLRRMFGPLTGQVSDRAERLTKRVADLLEIDTAIITYLAGVRMDYWDDPEPIIKGCIRNMSERWSSEADVREAFADASLEDIHGYFQKKSNILAQWFGG